MTLINNQAATGTVLIGDPEPDLRKALIRLLQQQGYSTAEAFGPDVLPMLRSMRPSLLFLDTPGNAPPPLQLLMRLRDSGMVLPIIVLTSVTAETPRVAAFQCSASDVVTKPCSVRELLERARIHLNGRASECQLQYGDLVLDFRSRSARCATGPINLTKREFQLLARLAQSRGDIVMRSELKSDVFRQSESIKSRALDFHITCLRKKIEGQLAPRYRLITVRGKGYALTRANAGGE